MWGGVKIPKSLEWKQRNRAFYWNKRVGWIDHPLCLQSKQYNKDMKGLTWVYYSKRDAKSLLRFLEKVVGGK